MATHCQTATRSGGGERPGERQNLGTVNLFEGKKGGGQLQTEGSNLLDVFVLTHFVIYMVFIVWKALKNNLDQFCR